MTLPNEPFAIDWKRLDGALSLGLSRQPLPPLPGAEALDEAARALAALALLGQKARLAPAVAPGDQTDVSRLPDDPRPMLEPAAREVLLRLDRRLDLDGRSLLTPMILAAVANAGRRLHLFDLQALETLLRAGGKRLGVVERAWLGRSMPSADVAVDRVTAFAQARWADPAAARETLAVGLAAEPAKQRAELVVGMVIGLGPDDAAFLEACLNDRAQGVREAAAAVLSRLPGSAAYAERLAKARAALGVETKGLLRKTRHLTYKLPSDSPRSADLVFEGFGLAELTADLPFAAADLPEAAAGAQAVLPLLARAALLDDDPRQAAAFLGRMTDAVWPIDLLHLPGDAQLLNPETRHAVLAASLTPEVVIATPRPGAGLADFLDGPMRPDLVSRLIASPPWRGWLRSLSETSAANDKLDLDAILLPVMVAIPPSAARTVADALAVLPPARRPKTDAWLAFLAQLATAPSNPSAPSETPVV